MPWPLSGSGAGPYVALYVITLALHAALIGYVLAGTGYAAVAALRRRTGDPIAETARDWLPFFLGAAITAGVAPLVFVQMLYPERFYTADLLAGPRWLAIVPALVVGFYALYVHKMAASPRRRVTAIAVAAVCFGFVAWSWTEHHLLMSADAERWHAFYAAGERVYWTAAVVPRLALWLASALSMFAVIAAWQVGDGSSSVPRSARPDAEGSRLQASGPERSLRVLAVLALVGIAASTALAVVVRGELDADARAGVDAAMPWLVVLIAGRAVEAVAWIGVLATRRRGLIALATGGAVASVLAGVALREAARMHLLAPAHPNAVAAGGAALFAIVAAVVIAAMAWVATLVRRAKAAAPVTPPEPPEPPSPEPQPEPQPEPPPG